MKIEGNLIINQQDGVAKYFFEHTNLDGLSKVRHSQRYNLAKKMAYEYTGNWVSKKYKMALHKMIILLSAAYTEDEYYYGLRDGVTYTFITECHCGRKLELSDEIKTKRGFCPICKISYEGYFIESILNKTEGVIDRLSIDELESYKKLLTVTDYSNYKVDYEALIELVNPMHLKAMLKASLIRRWTLILPREDEGEREMHFIYLDSKVIGLEENDKKLKKHTSSLMVFGQGKYDDFYKTKASELRRKRIDSMINDFTNEQRNDVLFTFDNECALTGKQGNIHMDHVLPVYIGHGGTTKNNMLPLSKCINASKGKKNIFEWYRVNGNKFKVCPDRFKRAMEYIADLNGMTVEEYKEYTYWCFDNPKTIEEVV